MIVCICNAINEKKIEEARASGASNAAGVYRHCGAKPQCGKCGSMIASIVQQKRS
jgi:bacterioferritin-associated ferredoxin